MSITKNDKEQNEYLKTILSELRELADKVKKIEVEIKDLKKSLLNKA